MRSFQFEIVGKMLDSLSGKKGEFFLRSRETMAQSHNTFGDRSRLFSVHRIMDC